MSLSWADIAGWRSAPLHAAERSLKTSRDKIVDFADEFETMAAPARWSGAAADEARRELRALTDRMEYLAAAVAAVHRAMIEAADAVAGVARAVTDAVDFASLHDLTLGPDGTVSDRATPPTFPTAHDASVAADERAGLVQECAARVAEALRKAADVDQDLVGVLLKITSHALGDGGAASLGDAARYGAGLGGLSLLAPPEGEGTAATNAAWWGSLSDAERERVIAEHPKWIGNRDGVDFNARDRANRLLLPDYQKQLEAEWAAEVARLAEELARGGNTEAIRQRMQEIADKVASLKTIEQLITLPDRHLLALDITHTRAQAALAVGDVTTADHVSVLTPGFTSTVQGMEVYDTDMRQLRAKAAWVTGQGAEHFAAVTWVGYQAPQWGTLGSSQNSVISQRPAEEGARSLAAFLRGINAARWDDPDLVALGHSYGATVTSLALRESTGVDRAATFGSPGMGEGVTLDRLKVRTGASYYLEATWDWVADLHRFGNDPTFAEGMRFPSSNEAFIPGVGQATGVSGHYDYLKEGTTSQYNLAVIAANLPELVVEGKNVGLTDIGAPPVWQGYGGGPAPSYWNPSWGSR